MKTITLNIHGFYGKGQNKTAARVDAEKQITAALAGTYRPRVIHTPHHYAVIWREPYAGWGYTICDTNTDMTPTHVFGTGYYDNADDAEAKARKHLGQYELNHILHLSGFSAALADLVITIVKPQTERDETEFCWWANWQHRAFKWRELMKDAVTGPDADITLSDLVRIGANTGKYPLQEWTAEDAIKSFTPLIPKY